MAKRRTNRKITIRLKPRNPEDDLAILTNIDEAFRPQDIEIVVGETEDDSPRISNEPLETEVRKAAAEALEAKNKKEESQEDDDKVFDEISLKHQKDLQDEILERTKLEERVISKIKKGWKIVSFVVGAAKFISSLVVKK